MMVDSKATTGSCCFKALLTSSLISIYLADIFLEDVFQIFLAFILLILHHILAKNVVYNTGAELPNLTKQKHQQLLIVQYLSIRHDKTVYKKNITLVSKQKNQHKRG